MRSLGLEFLCPQAPLWISSCNLPLSQSWWESAVLDLGVVLSLQPEEGRNSSVESAEEKDRNDAKSLVKTKKGKRKKVKNHALHLLVRKDQVILCLKRHSPKLEFVPLFAFWSILPGFFIFLTIYSQ